METTGKLICGALATALLAWGSHAMGNGEALLGKLTNRAHDVLSARRIDGVDVNFERNPVRRVALLSGSVDAATRSAALASVKAVPGIMDARWVDAAGAPVAVTQSAPAASPSVPKAEVTPAKVAPDPAPAPAKTDAPPAPAPVASGSCQGKVDAAIGNRGIEFRSGSPWVNFPARALIGDVAKALSQCPAATIAISGHADSTGSAAVNQTLSQARAEAVMAILVEKGVAASRITAKGYGSSRPATGGAQNDRRISFTVTGG